MNRPARVEGDTHREKETEQGGDTVRKLERRQH